MNDDPVRDVVAEVVRLAYRELARARRAHEPFNSAHEGFAVLMEEVDELWAEVVKGRKSRSADLMRHEAVQVAAMALRFVLDVCPAAEGDAE